MATRVVATRQHVSHTHTQMECSVYSLTVNFVQDLLQPLAYKYTVHIQLMQYHTPHPTHEKNAFDISPLRRICMFAILPF